MIYFNEAMEDPDQTDTPSTGSDQEALDDMYADAQKMLAGMHESAAKKRKAFRQATIVLATAGTTGCTFMPLLLLSYVASEYGTVTGACIGGLMSLALGMLVGIQVGERLKP